MASVGSNARYTAKWFHKSSSSKMPLCDTVCYSILRTLHFLSNEVPGSVYNGASITEKDMQLSEREM